MSLMLRLCKGINFIFITSRPQRQNAQVLMHCSTLKRGELRKLVNRRLKLKLRRRGKTSTGNWLNTLDALRMIEPQNWKVRDFCSWTVSGCIPLVDLPAFAKGGIKGKRHGNSSLIARRWARGRSFEKVWDHRWLILHSSDRHQVSVGGDSTRDWVSPEEHRGAQISGRKKFLVQKRNPSPLQMDEYLEPFITIGYSERKQG